MAPAGVLCDTGGGGGDQAMGQAPETCRPNAAQSVVLGGLRAHTRETASPFPWGGGGPCRKWSRRSASPPSPCPWARGKLACAGGGGGRGSPPKEGGGGSGNGAPVTEPLVKYQSPRREVVRSSAGVGVAYPPFLGSFT